MRRGGESSRGGREEETKMLMMGLDREKNARRNESLEREGER